MDRRVRDGALPWGNGMTSAKAVLASYRTVRRWEFFFCGLPCAEKISRTQFRQSCLDTGGGAGRRHPHGLLSILLETS